MLWKLRWGGVVLSLRALSWLRPADVSIFFQFFSPPHGGANQFLLALRDEFRRRGLRVENNTISRRTRACLFNSHHANLERLRVLRRRDCRMIHRVDGPIGVYRGRGADIDKLIWSINRELADATVFQSRYSLEAHRELGLEFKAPTVITNAVDPDIFFPSGRGADFTGRKVRLISSSWSDNPNKGIATYKWLDTHLDWERFEYTFVGRSSVEFEHIRAVEPVPSQHLAELLRQHDIYVAASLHDPCSNALLEALACGLPVVYAKSGGHPEIVGEAGLGFSEKEEIPALLERLVDEYEERRARIAILTLTEVADRYLAVMVLAPQAK